MLHTNFGPQTKKISYPLPYTTTSIVEEADGDPGDSTQRNFRYQHAYGVILLLDGVRRSTKLKRIWCEHHEDLLAEFEGEIYTAYQIKTREPELGAWKVFDDDLIKSINRFYHLEVKFGKIISSYNFVSNCKALKTGVAIKDTAKLASSPIRFLDAIKNAESIDSIAIPFLNTFHRLVERLKSDPQVLYRTLKKVQIVLGPSRDNFDSEVSHTHLGKLSDCKSMSPEKLDRIRDKIVFKIYYASSLYCDDPLRHLSSENYTSDPTILAKRVNVDDALSIIASEKNEIFNVGGSSMDIARLSKSSEIMKKKLKKANLEDMIDTMNKQKMFAEKKLLARLYTEEGDFESILSHLELVVQTTCDDAKAAAKQENIANPRIPIGLAMYNKVIERLTNIADKESDFVYKEKKMTLVGVAALLTESCTVWWGEKFDLNK